MNKILFGLAIIILFAVNVNAENLYQVTVTPYPPHYNTDKVYIDVDENQFWECMKNGCKLTESPQFIIIGDQVYRVSDYTIGYGHFECDLRNTAYEYIFLKKLKKKRKLTK